MGGGFAIGKMTQPITVNNISTATSISQANSYAVSGTITIRDKNATGLVMLSIKGLTNINAYTVINGVTNIVTNMIIIK